MNSDISRMERIIKRNTIISELIILGFDSEELKIWIKETNPDIIELSFLLDDLKESEMIKNELYGNGVSK